MSTQIKMLTPDKIPKISFSNYKFNKIPKELSIVIEIFHPKADSTNIFIAHTRARDCTSHVSCRRVGAAGAAGI